MKIFKNYFQNLFIKTIYIYIYIYTKKMENILKFLYHFSAKTNLNILKP